MRLQRTPWIGLVLATFTATSSADINGSVGQKSTASPGLATDTTGIPPECRQYLVVPSDSKSEILPWQQRLSLAACRQSIAVVPVSDPEQFRSLVATLDRGVAPSAAIYRDAMARGPDEIRIRAAYGLGMTHVTTMVRARNAIRVDHAVAMNGGASNGASSGALDRAEARRRALEPLLSAHRDAARAAFLEAIRIADLCPSAAHANPVVAYEIASARTQAQELH